MKLKIADIRKLKNWEVRYEVMGCLREKKEKRCEVFANEVQGLWGRRKVGRVGTSKQENGHERIMVDGSSNES